MKYCTGGPEFSSLANVLQYHLKTSTYWEKTHYWSPVALDAEGCLPTYALGH